MSCNTCQFQLQFWLPRPKPSKQLPCFSLPVRSFNRLCCLYSSSDYLLNLGPSSYCPLADTPIRPPDWPPCLVRAPIPPSVGLETRMFPLQSPSHTFSLHSCRALNWPRRRPPCVCADNAAPHLCRCPSPCLGPFCPTLHLLPSPPAALQVALEARLQLFKSSPCLARLCPALFWGRNFLHITCRHYLTHSVLLLPCTLTYTP